MRALIAEAYQRYLADDEGTVADYIPALACVPPSLFGICVVGVDGAAFGIGDVDRAFSIQSISKRRWCTNRTGIERYQCLSQNGLLINLQTFQQLSLFVHQRQSPKVIQGATVRDGVEVTDTPAQTAA